MQVNSDMISKDTRISLGSTGKVQIFSPSGFQKGHKMMRVFNRCYEVCGRALVPTFFFFVTVTRGWLIFNLQKFIKRFFVVRFWVCSFAFHKLIEITGNFGQSHVSIHEFQISGKHRKLTSGSNILTQTCVLKGNFDTSWQQLASVLLQNY